MQNKPSAIQYAFSWPVVRRAIILALIVGPILVAINHTKCVLNHGFMFSCALESFGTFLVPYTVSTVSSVMAMSDRCGMESGEDKG